jgi:electron transport complex protein RnfD
MATDPVTSPVSQKGKLLFGVGCGALSVVIRLMSGTEGIWYGILLMNVLVPLIDRWTIPGRPGKPI